MNISRETANNIIRELQDILSHQINLIDINSIIIASTDRTRIDTWHEGASILIENQLSELVVTDDAEFDGAKEGINLPIEINDEIVGVIGITGAYEEVVGYGRVIKKMTEVLLQEDILRELRQQKRTARNNFIQRWIIDDDYPRTQRFTNYGLTLGINTLSSWRVVLLQPGFDMFDTSAEQQSTSRKVDDAIELFMKRAEGKFFANGSWYLILLPALETEALRALLGEMQQEIRDRWGVTLFIGADSENSGGQGMHTSYQRAERALNASLMNRRKTIFFYDELDLEIFINDIPAEKRAEFVGTVFKNCDADEIRDACDMLTVFYSNNASINKTAEELYIHKNTLQYKLNRIAQKTGNNPRDTRGALLFQTALAFLDLDAD